MLEAALRDEGFDVHAIASGRDALDVVDEHDPDLIVLDVMMPGIDGFETLRRIRTGAFSNQVPVIMLTARASDADRLKGVLVRPTGEML